ncbi:MAG: cobalamin biosynthesis protein CobD/CbiB [Bacillota bacterium]
MNHLLALTLGVCLDILLGYPHRLPHPLGLVRILIGYLEKPFGELCSEPRQLRRAGAAMLIIVTVFTGSAVFLIMKLLYILGFWYTFAGEAALSYLMLSGGSVAREAKKVANTLSESLEAARNRAAILAGDHTQALGRGDIIRVTAGTVARNTAEGLFSPIFYLFIGGPMAGAIFKAVSMTHTVTGNRNGERRDIGRAGAIADGVFSFVPARIAGVFMVCAAAILRLDYRNAWKTIKDRKNCNSLDGRWPEFAAAGALHIRLAGTPQSGEMAEKPMEEDGLREPEVTDIKAATGMMFTSYGLGFAFFAIVYALICIAAGWMF